MKDSFCSHCGSSLQHCLAYPKHCLNCNTQIWSNPLPVVAVLMEVVDYDTIPGGARAGVLIQRRNIEPQKGKLALSGGYIDAGETWQTAAAREIKEELNISTNENHYRLYDVLGGNNNMTMLVFTRYEYSLTWNDALRKKFVPNEEVSEMTVMWEETELAFPAHTLVANRFLKRIKEAL
jgi:8-oxo-dGTP diphosphatase